jgi:integrase
MGRRRLHTNAREPLPPGLYKVGRQYRARLPGGAWHYFGTDYVSAVSGYAAWSHSGKGSDNVAWLLDLFTGSICPSRVRANRLSARTARDYTHDAAILKKGLGHIPLVVLEAKHVARFRDARAEAAPSHVRNEMACLSAALSYAVESGRVRANVAKDVARPSRSKRMRLISDSEYLTVHQRCGASLRLAMTLAVRTLALPDDLLSLGPRNLMKLQDGRRILRFNRGKTGVVVEIELVGELAKAIEEFLDKPVVYETFLHTREGERYTRDGIGAMFRRACVGTKARPADPRVADFGIRDLRAKGATEMYRTGVNIRLIQHLLGHRSVRTTEIYLKSLVPETVRPNEVPIVAPVAG